MIDEFSCKNLPINLILLISCRYKTASTTMIAKPSFYSIMPHYNPMLIANSDKEYETQVLKPWTTAFLKTQRNLHIPQILEMSMPEDNNSVKGGINATFTVDEDNYRPRLAPKHE